MEKGRSGRRARVAMIVALASLVMLSTAKAFALTGKANVTDPACEKSPDRDVLKLPLQTAQIEAPEFLYRSFSHGGALTSID